MDNEIEFAARNGDLETCKNLVKQTDDCSSAFIIAARCGHVEICKLFIDNSCVDLTGRHGVVALELAIMEDRIDVCNFLINKGVDVNKTLHEVSNRHRFIGGYKLFKFLLDRGASIQSVSDVALSLAVAYNQTDLFELLIDRGFDIHKLDDLALRRAAFHGNVRMCKFLLERGADVHARNDEALDFASKRALKRSECLDICKLLLEYGANPKFAFTKNGNPRNIIRSFISKNEIKLIRNEIIVEKIMRR